MALHIPWCPRLLLSGRVFRLPVAAADAPLELTAPDFAEIARRYSPGDDAYFLYLRAPTQSGDYDLTARQGVKT